MSNEKSAELLRLRERQHRLELEAGFMSICNLATRQAITDRIARREEEKSYQTYLHPQR